MPRVGLAQTSANSGPDTLRRPLRRCGGRCVQSLSRSLLICTKTCNFWRWSIVGEVARCSFLEEKKEKITMEHRLKVKAHVYVRRASRPVGGGLL